MRGRINLIDKHIAWCEQTQRLAGRFEEDRYSRVRSINKTADARPYGGFTSSDAEDPSLTVRY